MNDYYEHYYQSKPDCNACEEKELKFDDAQEYLTEVVKQLYGNERLDVARFEDVLDGLCHLFHVALPANLPTIERKKEASILKDWIEFNNKHLKQLA